MWKERQIILNFYNRVRAAVLDHCNKCLHVVNSLIHAGKSRGFSSMFKFTLAMGQQSYRYRS